MLSPNNQFRKSGNSRTVRLSLLIGLGLILFLFESLIPRPLPWMKPGLAHIATLLALYLFGDWEALLVVVFRVIAGSLILGTLFNPAFVLAISGGIAATLSMIYGKRFFSNIFSIYGISILGALVHSLTQLGLVNFLLVHRLELFYLIPIMALTSVIAGFVIAFTTNLILTKGHIISN